MTGLWKASALLSQPHHKSHGPSKASSKIKVLPYAAFMGIFLIKITRGPRSAEDQWKRSLHRGTFTYLPLLIKHNICWKCALPSLKKITTTTLCYFLHLVIHSGVRVQAASIIVQMMSNLTPLSRSENLRHHQVKNWFYPFKLMGKGLLWGCMNVPPKITLALLPHTFVELQLCLVPRKCSTPRSSSRYKLCYCQLASEALNLRSLYLFCSVLCL